MNPHRVRTTALVFGVLLASACESPVTNGQFSAVMLTDGDTFAMVPGNAGGLTTEIPYSYRNESPRPIYVFLGCRYPPPSIEKKVGDSWKHAWRATTINDCAVLPSGLVPGQSMDEIFRVTFYPLGSDVEPVLQFAFEEIEGTYRLKWEEDAVLTRYSENSETPSGPIDLSSRVSNEFTLTVP